MKRLLTLLAVSACVALPARASDLKSDVAEAVGAWKIAYDAPDRGPTTSLIVLGRQHEELDAWLVTEDGWQPFDDVQLSGDAVQLSIKPEQYYGDVTAKLEARPSGPGACQGTIAYDEAAGQSGTIRFVGEQLKPESFEQASTWRLHFASPDGVQRRPLVTVVEARGKLYGWYSDADYELPATSVTIDGRNVTMKATAKTRDGEKVDVTFHGVLDGDAVSGTAKWSTKNDSGSFAFAGEQVKKSN